TVLRADALPAFPDRGAFLAAVRGLAAALGARTDAARRALRVGHAAGPGLVPARPPRARRPVRRSEDRGREVLRPYEVANGREKRRLASTNNLPINRVPSNTRCTVMRSFHTEFSTSLSGPV